MLNTLRDIRSMGREVMVPDDIYETAWQAIMDPSRREDWRQFYPMTRVLRKER